MADEATTAAAKPVREQQANIRALVERAQTGDREALEELYLIHFYRIYSYLHMSVGNRHDAEDLTTQTFLKMLESIKRFRWQSAPFSAWLFRIAHNLAMDHFRAARRWQPEEEVPEPPGEEEPSAEAQALQSIGRQSMLELIDALPGVDGVASDRRSRHGGDPRRASRPRCRGRWFAEGDAGGDSDRRGARHGAGIAREPQAGRRP